MKGMTREQKVEFKRKVRVEDMVDTLGRMINYRYTLQDLTENLGTIEAYFNFLKERDEIERADKEAFMALQDKYFNGDYGNRPRTHEEIEAMLDEEDEMDDAKMEAMKGVKEPATTEIVRDVVRILRNNDLAPQDFIENLGPIEAYINLSKEKRDKKKKEKQAKTAEIAKKQLEEPAPIKEEEEKEI